MAEQDVPLSEDEVRQISRLIETLNASTFDYLQLEFGDLKLTLAKGGQGLAPAAAAVASAPPSGIVSSVAAAPPAAAAGSSPAPVTATPAAAAAAHLVILHIERSEFKELFAEGPGNGGRKKVRMGAKLMN